MNKTIFIMTMVASALVTLGSLVSVPAYGQNQSGGQQQQQQNQTGL